MSTTERRVPTPRGPLGPNAICRRGIVLGHAKGIEPRSRGHCGGSHSIAPTFGLGGVRADELGVRRLSLTLRQNRSVWVAAGFATLVAGASCPARAEPPAQTAPKAIVPAPQSAPAPAVSGPSAADDIAQAFSSIGKELYEECIFELSDEQVEVQAALVLAYMEQGADGATARKLAANQIQPPKVSSKCEQLRRSPEAASGGWNITLAVPKAPEAVRSPAAQIAIPKKPDVAPVAKVPQAAPAPSPAAPAASGATKTSPADKAAPVEGLAARKMLPQWDCADNVDYVTVKINGYDRKLTGGEICNPYEDVVQEVPAELATFRLGYVIKTGRMFVVSDGGVANGQTIAWAISGRDVCRNNPDGDCLAARAIGPLPPGEYAFASSKEHRVSWGPRTKRNVAGVFLKRLWNKDRFSKAQIAGMLARRNIAIHVRLKGEMSEACLGLEPKGWAYVAGLIKDGRATGLNVYIDEPHPQIAGKPPVIVASGFSLTSLFK